jgi:hypothetical protein
MKPPPERLARIVTVLAGAMDLSAGLALVFLPGLALRLMGVAPLTGDGLVFLRFVGAFVAAVGATYLWALRRPAERLRVVLGATLFFRFAAGSYSLFAIATGLLDVAWASVPATDFALVGLQAWLLARGVGRNA